MRREQRRQSCWASTDNDYTCATKAQCHLLRRSPNGRRRHQDFLWGNARQDTAGSLGQTSIQGEVQQASCLRSLRCNWSSAEGFSLAYPLCSNQKVLWAGYLWSISFDPNLRNERRPMLPVIDLSQATAQHIQKVTNGSYHSPHFGLVRAQNRGCLPQPQPLYIGCHPR